MAWTAKWASGARLVLGIVALLLMALLGSRGPEFLRARRLVSGPDIPLPALRRLGPVHQGDGRHESLRALATRADGEVIGADQY